MNCDALPIKGIKPQGRSLDPFSGASPGELTIVPIPAGREGDGGWVC